VSHLTEQSGCFPQNRAYLPRGNGPISKDKAFEDCVILSKDAFDPDAVFLDDIVDDEVLPYLSLAVDGLNTSSDAKKGKLELRPEDVAANEELVPDTTLPVATLGSAGLDVDEWNVSLWGKLRNYFGA